MRVAALGLAGLTVEAGYQLQVEDVAAVAACEVALFVDSARSGPAPFFVQAVQAHYALSLSTHSLSPANALGMAHELFGAQAVGFVVGIRGATFEAFGEGLSAAAQGNLECAFQYLAPVLEARDVRDLSARSTLGQGLCRQLAAVENPHA